MARGRFLSAAIGEDFRLNSLSLEAQLVYLMAIPHLDVDGIMPGHPTLVHARACPLKTELRDKMPAIIDEWVNSGLVIRYDSDGEEALFFAGFPKNQRVRRDREASSRFADPPGWTRDEQGGLVPGGLQDNSGSNPGVLHPNTIQSNTTTTTTRAGARSGGGSSVDPLDEQAVIDAWVDNEMAGSPKGTTRTILRELLATHGKSTVIAAISIAAEQDRRTLAYVKGVLRKGINSRASPSGASPYAGWVLVRDDEDADE